jgi:branched-subunit amino acid transport protein AzlD
MFGHLFVDQLAVGVLQLMAVATFCKVHIDTDPHGRKELLEENLQASYTQLHPQLLIPI